MMLLVAFAVVALGISFLCSILEAVLLSVTPGFVAARVREERPGALLLKRLKDDVDRPLAAILTLNTVANTVGAAGVGAQAAILWGEASLAVASGLLTLAILVFSEVIPKTLGALHWRRLAPAAARILAVMTWVLWPFVRLARGLTRLLSRGARTSVVSREEIAALAELGAQHGVFAGEESRILKNLFRFHLLRVRDVMTPRPVVFALPEALTVGEVIREHAEFRFSRIPVFDSNRDDVTGYVLKDELLLRAAQGRETARLAEFKRDILDVSDSLVLPALLERLLKHLEHIALVVDEYGGMAGIVTLEDVVETLLGMEIVDEADSVEDMQDLARRQWERRARRLGLVEGGAPANGERERAIRLGITGGIPPR